MRPLPLWLEATMPQTLAHTLFCRSAPVSMHFRCLLCRGHRMARQRVELAARDTLCMHVKMALAARTKPAEEA